jgi:hypothetical protein
MDGVVNLEVYNILYYILIWWDVYSIIVTLNNK